MRPDAGSELSAKPFTRFDFITLSHTFLKRKVSGAVAPFLLYALSIRPAPRSRLIISIFYTSASTSTAEFRLKKYLWGLTRTFLSIQGVIPDIWVCPVHDKD